MENATTKMIVTVVGIILVTAAMTAYILSFRGAGKVVAASGKQAQALDISVPPEDMMQFAGATVKGSDVLAFIKSSRGKEICVTVKTGEPGGTMWEHSYNYEDGSLSVRQDDERFNDEYQKALNFGDSRYIDPLLTFKSDIVEDSGTRAVKEVIFEVAP